MQPIFFDPNGRRWRRTCRVAALLAVPLLGLAVMVWVRLMAPAHLPRLPLPQAAAAVAAPALPIDPIAAPGLPAPFARGAAPWRVGFFVDWDDNSGVSLRRHAG